MRRDRGICAGCGRDGEKLAAAISELDRRLCRIWTGRGRVWGAALNAALAPGWGRPFIKWRPPTTWEADHIVPVAEGGGGCGLDGYRTLCRPCHMRETAALRSRLSAARKADRDRAAAEAAS